jgi:hypothetical protein
MRADKSLDIVAEVWERGRVHYLMIAFAGMDYRLTDTPAGAFLMLQAIFHPHP